MHAGSCMYVCMYVHHCMHDSLEYICMHTIACMYNIACMHTMYVCTVYCMYCTIVCMYVHIGPYY